MKQWTVTQLRKEVEEYFRWHDESVIEVAKVVLEDFWKTLEKWIEDKELYQNEYQRRYYNPFPANSASWDAERAFLILKQIVETELQPRGFWPSLTKIENGIEVKINWEV